MIGSFSKEELLKIAENSVFKLDDKELALLESQLQTTLEYVKQLNEVSVSVEQEAQRTINVFREDTAVLTDTAPLLAQAPEVDSMFFVVPKVLD